MSEHVSDGNVEGIFLFSKLSLFHENIETNDKKHKICIEFTIVVCYIV